MPAKKVSKKDKLIKKLRSALKKTIRLLLEMPDLPPEVGPNDYTDYCTGADGTKKQPYPKRRNRQCSIGYHTECTDPKGDTCGCPCHVVFPLEKLLRDK